jgi:hypothetical protein
MAFGSSFGGGIASGGGGGTPGGSTTQVQFNDGGAFGGDSGLTYDKITDALTVGSITSTIFTALPANNTSAFVASGSSLTGTNAQSLVNLSQTWNTTGTPTAIFANITDTASNASSLLFLLQVGGATKFSVTKFGAVTVANTLTVNAFTTTSGINSTYYSINSDTFLSRDASGIFAQRNAANSQVSRLYKSFTDASNYTRSAWQFDANGVQLAGESAGTGDANISITLTPKGTGSIRTTGKIYPATDALAAQTAAGILAGTGAPSNANGSDGDFYLRSDGGALSTIYQKRAGTWAGIV